MGGSLEENDNVVQGVADFTVSNSTVLEVDSLSFDKNYNHDDTSWVEGRIRVVLLELQPQSEMLYDYDNWWECMEHCDRR